MKALLEPIKEIARFDELFRDLKKGTAGVTVISGCLESQKAHMIAGLSEDVPVRLLIAENELKAKELYEDYRLYDAETLYYPAKDLIFYQADIHGNLLIRQRLQVIQALLERKEESYHHHQCRGMYGLSSASWRVRKTLHPSAQ